MPYSTGGKTERVTTAAPLCGQRFVGVGFCLSPYRFSPSPLLLSLGVDISHDRSQESLQAKAAWFRSLSIEERMEYFCEMADLVLELNPAALEVKRRAESIPGRVRVLTRA